jgi:hypothetical protein
VQHNIVMANLIGLIPMCDADGVFCGFDVYFVSFDPVLHDEVCDRDDYLP